MSFFTDLLITTSGWLRPHIAGISLAIVATLLVIYGSTINRIVKVHIQGMHFFIRTAAFVALCAFGYGLISIFLTPYVNKMLASISNLYLGSIVVLIFILLGFLAERQR